MNANIELAIVVQDRAQIHFPGMTLSGIISFLGVFRIRVTVAIEAGHLLITIILISKIPIATLMLLILIPVLGIHQRQVPRNTTIHTILAQLLFLRTGRGEQALFLQHCGEHTDGSCEARTCLGSVHSRDV